MTTPTEIDFVDHGIDNPQYFQGCGVALTRFDHSITGIGVNFKEAVEDALEMMAQSDVNTDGMLELILADAPKHSPSVSEEDDESYYHVSVRWRD